MAWSSERLAPPQDLVDRGKIAGESDQGEKDTVLQLHGYRETLQENHVLKIRYCKKSYILKT